MQNWCLSCEGSLKATTTQTWEGDGFPEHAETVTRSSSTCPRVAEHGGRERVWVFLNCDKTKPSSLLHSRGTSGVGCKAGAAGGGGLGSGARQGAQPEPALYRWQQQGLHQVSLDPVFHSKIKNLPSGENEKEIVQ